jgi:ketosteroid isomerase-like protein
MTTMVERLRDATNAHDPRGLASLFTPDYRSIHPVHPNREFGGSAQVLQNWTSVFEGVPDFTAELVASAVDGQTEWAEWSWQGHHVDGSPFAMRGVTVFVVRDALVVEGRFYMEPVDADGGDIDAAVQEMYKPPSGTSG